MFSCYIIACIGYDSPSLHNCIVQYDNDYYGQSLLRHSHSADRTAFMDKMKTNLAYITIHLKSMVQ